MSNPERVSPPSPSVRPRGAGSEFTSHCSQCDAPVDPLRAARVRILDGQFHYFCSAACADDYEPREPAEPSPTPISVDNRRRSERATEGVQNPPTDSALGTPESVEGSAADPVTPTSVSTRRSWSGRRAPSPVEERVTPKDPVSPLPEAPAPPSVRTDWAAQDPLVLLQASVVGAALCILLLLAVEGSATDWIRLGLATFAGLLQTSYGMVRARATKPKPLSLEPLVLSVIGLATVALAATALLQGDERSDEWVSLAGTHFLLWGLSALLVAAKERPLERTRRSLSGFLERTVLRVSGEQTSSASAEELSPGEDIVVHAGEVLPVDASIVAGTAEVSPWLHSGTVREVATGDLLYAGSKLLSGQVRAVVRWTGNDRHWLRLTTDPQRRADVHAPAVLLVQRLASRAAPAGVFVTAALSWSQNHPPVLTWAYALAAASVLWNPALKNLVKAEVLRATFATLGQGIVITHAKVLEVAGRVSRAVFCARGTLLLGEPQLSTLEPLGSASSDEVLALVAGAEQSSTHPIASSVLRAARAAGILPDAVRNPRSEPGLGVIALASDGRALVVGSRALMLRERVSVARAEARITELEATGRTVLLVALGGHLSAILSFQDGLRKGARAAVQHLLDAGIEPVLLSGDARETCEALAKTLDIEHVRPDVLPADRGREVERLRGGGATVAVVGRSPVDDLPLASATLSIALPSQGLQAAGFDIDLASDEVHKASLALRLLHAFRIRVQRAIWVLFGGGLLVVLGGVALSVSPAWLPFLGVCGLGLLRVWTPDARNELELPASSPDGEA